MTSQLIIQCCRGWPNCPTCGVQQCVIMCVERSQFHDEKPDELESEFDHFDVDNSYPSPCKGPNIVDSDFVYKQLLDGHKPCKTTLSFTQYQRERLIGLTDILYRNLQNCSTVTMVKTSIYDGNTK